MTSRLTGWLSGIASSFMPRQVTPPLSEQQMRVVSKASVIANKASVNAKENKAAEKPFTAQPLSDKGWFAPVTGFFRDMFYSCVKGRESNHSQEVREAYQGIGGTEITLQASATLNVRTVTFTAANFSKTIKDAGGKFVDLVDPKNGQVLFPAIELENGLPTQLQKYLKQLGILNSEYGEGQWKTFRSDGKTYLVSKADYEKVTTSQYTNMSSGNLEKSSIVVKPRGDVACKAHSTVILSGPLFSRFESSYTAQEVGAFLVRGVDVVVFEDKNPTVWDSESVTNTKAARDAIYHHVMSKPGMTPNRIVWKGTCFGALPGVAAAAAHPGTGVIADSPFIRFSDSASDYADQNAWGKWIPKAIRTPVIALVAEANDCEHSLEKALPKVQGPICLLENDRDQVIPEEVRKNLRNLLPKQQGNGNKVQEVVHINHKDVDHADGWYKDPKASLGIDMFLKNIGATHGSFLNHRMTASMTASMAAPSA